MPRVEKIAFRGNSMQKKRLGILISVLFVAFTAFAQVTGAGVPGFLPQFTGTNQIGDSIVFEVPGDSIGIGTTAPHATLNVQETGTNSFVIRGTTTRTSGFGGGVLGETSNPDGFGVLGTNNTGVAVSGWMNSGAGWGIVGNNFSLDANSGGGGVEGLIQATTGFTTAIRGTALGKAGPSVAVFGEQFSPEGQAGLFINRAGGNILVGSVSQNPDRTVFRVDGHGTVFADGGFRPFGADFAEAVQVNGSADRYAPGDLLVIDPSGDRRLSKSQTPYSTLVAGIYSTQPGVVASQHRADEALSNNEVPLAIVGIVPCKASAENGPIEVGDLLVASATPGYAMKGTDRSKMLGAVVGKALGPLQEGKGVIQVLVTLQ
jgi:hypothetical protein